MSREYIKTHIENSIRLKQEILASEQFLDKIALVVDICVESLKNGGCIFFCGNGGSAADAQHLSAELTGRYAFDRPPLRSEALHTDTSYLTAVANDYSYEEVYARLLRGKARQGDVLFGISTSGNSANICKAFEAAKEIGVKTIGLTGNGGGKIKALCDILIDVPSTLTPNIQESHIMIGHILCKGIEDRIYG